MISVGRTPTYTGLPWFRTPIPHSMPGGVRLRKGKGIGMFGFSLASRGVREPRLQEEPRLSKGGRIPERAWQF